jgi:CRISPR-associated protein Csm2
MSTPYRGTGPQGRDARSDQGRGPRGRPAQDQDDQVSLDVSGVVFAEKPSPQLFAEIAEEAAKAVAGPRGPQNRQNRPSQLRRFYDELVMWQEKVGASGERFGECEPYIRMLKAKVAYAKGREHVDANFEKLLGRIIDQIRDTGTLRQAKLFLEAFMAYYKVYGPK